MALGEAGRHAVAQGVSAHSAADEILGLADSVLQLRLGPVCCGLEGIRTTEPAQPSGDLVVTLASSLGAEVVPQCHTEKNSESKAHGATLPKVRPRQPACGSTVGPAGIEPATDGL